MYSIYYRKHNNTNGDGWNGVDIFFLSAPKARTAITSINKQIKRSWIRFIAGHTNKWMVIKNDSLFCLFFYVTFAVLCHSLLFILFAYYFIFTTSSFVIILFLTLFSTLLYSILSFYCFFYNFSCLRYLLFFLRNLFWRRFHCRLEKFASEYFSVFASSLISPATSNSTILPAIRINLQ